MRHLARVSRGLAIVIAGLLSACIPSVPKVDQVAVVWPAEAGAAAPEELTLLQRSFALNAHAEPLGAADEPMGGELDGAMAEGGGVRCRRRPTRARTLRRGCARPRSRRRAARPSTSRARGATCLGSRRCSCACCR